MNLQILWFCLIAVLWGGYFVLEGFDFGVGMLLPFLPRNEQERGALFQSIGPVWDGNEVWLVVAGAAMFAAFPAWYATVFSGFYLALLLILVLLILRVVSFEWRGKGESTRWRATWLTANAAGSFGAPFLWGIALANLLHGVPLASNGDWAGSFADLFSVYTVFAGIAVVVLFAFHGSTFLTLRTEGELLKRTRRAARTLALPAVVLAGGFLAWTVVVAVDRNDKSVLVPVIPAALSGAALVLASVLISRQRSSWAFASTAVSTALLVATIFAGLYPRLIVSVPDFGNSLTVPNAASAHYTLAVMSVVAAIALPVVLVYQAWTYYVFRARVTGDAIVPPSPTR
jgi:cytochrome bd ubiquinol oxidase subunit II